MNWVQTIIVILAIGGPALGRAAQVLGDRAKKRQEAKDREQAFENSLRTGHASSTTPRKPQYSAQQQPTPSRNEILAQKREELLKKRRQQLQELKRRQIEALQRQKAQNQGSAQRAGRTSSAQPRTASPSRLSRAAQQQARAAQQQVQVQTGQRSKTSKGPRAAANVYRDGPEIHRIDPVGHTHSKLSDIKPFEIHESNLQAHESTLRARKQIVHPRTEDGDSFKADAPRHPFLDIPSTPAQWRRYLIAREILNAPIALRPPGNNTAGMF